MRLVFLSFFSADVKLALSFVCVCGGGGLNDGITTEKKLSNALSPSK